MLESPQSFVVREECQKAASQNGFRRILGEEAGWAAFGSTTAHGTIHLAASGPQGPWFLALDHLGVIQELSLPAATVSGPSRARFAFDTLGALYAVLHRVYELGVSLPDAPLREFERRVADLPRTTEAERLVVQRIGQDIFRDRLMDYWQGRCPLTGISDPALLRASHIIPWADCESDAERLDDRTLAAGLPRLILEARKIAATVIHGLHGRRRSGSGENFWQYRRFLSGEPARRVDWRRSARDDHLYQHRHAGKQSLPCGAGIQSYRYRLRKRRYHVPEP